jgi:hypothetical protein
MLRRAAIVLAAAATFVACDFTGPCENDPTIEIASTDGSASAWVFVRDCGATTARSTQVSILRPGEGPPTGPGNVFIIGSEAQVVATWREPGHVDISFDGTGEVFKQEASAAGVTITYNAE